MTKMSVRKFLRASDPPPRNGSRSQGVLRGSAVRRPTVLERRLLRGLGVVVALSVLGALMSVVVASSPGGSGGGATHHMGRCYSSYLVRDYP